ncbi:MAG: hydantoinase B/oxoprolinase family protein [Bacteroidota bacterium]
MHAWQIWVDTGGTFTDCLALDLQQKLHRLKVLSNGALRGRVVKRLSPTKIQVELVWPTQAPIYDQYKVRIFGKTIWEGVVAFADPASGLLEVDHPFKGKSEGATIELHTGEEVPVFAARILTETKWAQKFPPIDMKLGSTRGTNAILERKGARTAFLVTKGFKDLLVIGNQQRPDLFALNIVRPQPLYHAVLEVDERIDANGRTLSPLTEEECIRITSELRKQKIESVAIALMNSYQNAVHEKQLSNHLRQNGFAFVSPSSELSGQVKLLQRAETAVANAYLAPIINQYLHKVRAGLDSARLRVMTSAGGLVDADHFFPKDSLLSGPAGGVVGAATTARLSGIDKLITFDMGGTSTDVSLFNQRYDYRYESKVGHLKILSPSLAIETIAAGGGSICSFDGYRFTVGPESAGAHPGPACYGAGGPLTITDVNLLSGRIDPLHFAMPLSVAKAKEALHGLIATVRKATRRRYTPQQVLRNYLQIANEKMAEAIRKVSTQHGHNPADFTLLSFGGAGGQHACALATMLGMRQVLIPYDAGLLSAYGIGHAKTERFKEALMLQPLHSESKNLSLKIDQLFREASTELQREGYDASQVELSQCLLFVRFRGQENALELSVVRQDLSAERLLQLFRKKYQTIFGHWLPDREIEIESMRVVASVAGNAALKASRKARKYTPAPQPVYRWENLTPGAFIQGPALIVSNNSTTCVDNGWTFYLDENNNGLLKSNGRATLKSKAAFEGALELYTNRFTAVAQEMGALLQRTSFSVNVKERLDFSCALLDRDGYLVVNAPHIPVHLGSLGVCVREVRKQIAMGEGDVIITNHPAFGGSHLPDVTLIKPVYFQKKRVGFVANRSHHAEIGGMRPGSMPANATRLEQEGVIIGPTYLVKKGKPQWEVIHKIFTTGPYPTRLWEENQADLNGALAAVNHGERSLQSLCKQFGLREVSSYMRHLRSHAALLMQQSIQSLKNKPYKAVERLDDGAVLQVSLLKKGSSLYIDFQGSAPAHAGNLNATRAIVQSVVLYVLRLLIDKPLPMNEGLLEQVKINLPEGILNPSFDTPDAPAVVGGNTEVSQRLTDTLLKALGLAACSQGTMNNFLFGNALFGYYETICGGTGAGPGFAGASGVHQHMTNTRITDPELLELRYPVRLESFAIRKNSGGRGKWRGGDGVVRSFYFLAPLEINILSQHRKEKPYGMQGGLPGQTGKQYVVRANGAKELLQGMDSTQVQEGDRLVIETPGGGGWGKA